MSGTSMDGISVALITTDGDQRVERGPAMTIPYNSVQRAAIARALKDAISIQSRHERPGSLAVLERELTELHAAAVSAFVRHQGVDRASIDVIGFHGHTVLHRPEAGLTVQLGDGPLLAELTGLPVIYDLRARDVAAGGQGAPLVPVYHRALVANLAPRPVAILNLGGVANVTYVREDGQLLAFDTGPGNALLDDWMTTRAGAAFDEDGQTAMVGRPDDCLVRTWLSDPFFSRPPPKSLDRNQFAVEGLFRLSLEDGAATLVAFTAAAIAQARAHLPAEPGLWIVCGGGRRNRALMSAIAGRVENAVVPAEVLGLDGDAIEAEAWAYLAVRALLGLAITYPGTTGVPEPMTGGVLARPFRAFG
jgi:anhydro-N-acetylmuramic acid kinase